MLYLGIKVFELRLYSWAGSLPAWRPDLEVAGNWIFMVEERPVFVPSAMLPPFHGKPHMDLHGRAVDMLKFWLKPSTGDCTKAMI